MSHIVSDPNRRWPKGTIFFEFDMAFDQYKPSFDISAPVGVGGWNSPDDVRRVQGYLNKYQACNGGPAPALVVDGHAGPKTVAAIRQFQTAHFGWHDGRVDPGGPTLVELTTCEVDPNPNQAKAVILNAVHEWNKELAGRPRWVRRRPQDLNYVVFRPGGFNKSEALGMKGGMQAVWINMTRAQGLSAAYGGTPKGVVIHEMGHVAGLAHEHQRSDRDNFVAIHWGNVSPDRLCAFLIPVHNKGHGCDSDLVSPHCTPVGPYDYLSTMHYFSTQGAARKGATTIAAKYAPGRPMGSFNGLSAGDKATLQKYYP